MNIALHGHPSYHVYTVNINGEYKEVLLPMGVLMPAFMLDPELQALNQGEDHEGIENHGINFRKNYYALKHFVSADGRGYYAVDRFLGTRIPKSGGCSLYNFVANPDLPVDLIVWDEGLGGITIPQNVNSVLWISKEELPDKEQFKKIAEKCFLIIDADILRSSGAMISRQISWERTIIELVNQLEVNSDLVYLMKSKFILLTFAEDGAVYIDNSGEKPEAHLILTHGGCEGTLRETVNGSFDNLFGIRTTAFILSALQKSKSFCDGITIEAIRGVIQVAEGIMLTGFEFDDDDEMISEADLPEKNWPAFSIPITHDKIMKINEDWTIAGNVGAKEDLYNVALQYVTEGSAVIDGLPQLKLGALTTIDRWEIEAYQDIRNLIINYAAGDDIKPLNIAVFGAPGSGKSFGVTQIAQNIIPGKIEKLEFNVSQFLSPGDLGNAFQKVRDSILMNKLPLVFFDEFDSDRDGMPLGWIKSFLMPMQDGKFRDDSGEHPLGRCILVFAGGTASTFEAFTNKNPNFAEIKGPDFISRLRGTINVSGPNPGNENDFNYMLRRALLLRSMCERKLDMTKEKTPIHSGIIRAMLLVPMYKHGARSMEAIFNMSRLTDGVLEPASLPSKAQLSLHVDAEAFIGLVMG